MAWSFVLAKEMSTSSKYLGGASYRFFMGLSVCPEKDPFHVFLTGIGIYIWLLAFFLPQLQSGAEGLPILYIDLVTLISV